MIEFEISGIKCDTPHCNYRDDSVKFEEYPNYLGKPCPVCGANLLSHADYDMCLKQYRIVAKYNKIMNVLKWFNPFHYIRLIFGDKREKKEVIKKF